MLGSIIVASTETRQIWGGNTCIGVDENELHLFQAGNGRDENYSKWRTWRLRCPYSRVKTIETHKTQLWLSTKPVPCVWVKVVWIWALPLLQKLPVWFPTAYAPRSQLCLVLSQSSHNAWQWWRKDETIVKPLELQLVQNTCFGCLRNPG